MARCYHFGQVARRRTAFYRLEFEVNFDMSLRKALAAFLMVMMTSPAWGGAESVGNVTASNDATVRNTRLTTGSTVFSGDVISVGDHGVTRLALASGAQAEILGNSLVRLTREGDKL